MRLWPRSLLGQMLLGVAAALLVAQTLSAVLLYRAGEERREAGALNAVAFSLLSFEASSGERGERRGPRGVRVREMAALPAAVLASRDAGLEERLAAILSSQGIVPADIAVAELALADDPVASHWAGRRGQFDDPRARGEARLLIAAIRISPDAPWMVAGMPRRDRASAALQAVVTQTVIIYVVLVGLLALLLRRITRPLGQLTRRVEHFGETPGVREPLRPRGPGDIADLIAAHNRMEARIAALLDEKDVMLGAIGHDLKTPLAALRVRIESVEDEAERAKMAASIEDLTQSLDDILALARIGRAGHLPERTDLCALIAGVVEEFEDMNERVELAETPRTVAPVHVTWLRRALRNLIANALRYGGEARISLARENGQVVMRVEDSGPGIPEKRIAEMQEPFARGEGSRNRSTGGAGLGLTIARAVAQQHGGELCLSNRSEGGLRAEIRLPL